MFLFPDLTVTPMPADLSLRAKLRSLLRDWPGARRLGANAAWLMGDRLMRPAVGLVVGA